MSDDVGPFNISAYNHGMMGYRTPYIDRLAQTGAMFTDWYGKQSCTAGRAASISFMERATKAGKPAYEHNFFGQERYSDATAIPTGPAA